jgi:arthrofactin-type cyclic lipopeptide synthetase C
MYTSGSTGTPKGVVVPHRAIVRLVRNAGYADFGPHDRVALAANPAFDATTMEVWAPLLNGGAVVVIGHDVLLDPARFAAELEARSVTVLWMTVGLFNRYAEALSPVLPRLRYLIVGGDVLDPCVIAGVLRRSPPRHLLNGYGPTETTTFAVTHEVRAIADETKGIPLGRPIGNTRVYVLDARRRLVPAGVAGELYIGGPGVALGYLNRPELTADRFLPDPFADDPGRMYRTGDLARWLEDGTLEFLGRSDDQVKIRGFRIEPGEIEHRLATVPGVTSIAVVVREDSGEKRLVAYFTGAAEAESLRAHARAELPDYMVPSAYVRLEVLPLNANGKVDRRALPAPDGASFVTRAFEVPRGDVEVTLARIWSELLKQERIGRHDSFFDLGGHSLLGVHLITRVQRELGVDVALRELFVHPTLAEFAAVAGGTAAPPPPNLVPLRPAGTLPPLFAVHTGGGTVEYLRALADHLDARLPLYGLEASGWIDADPPIRSIREMADRYVAAIRTVQPKGPYRLVGYSAGGLVAYAMAEHLSGMGETVEFLGIIDTRADMGTEPGFFEAITRLIDQPEAGMAEAVFFRQSFEHLVPAEARAEFEQVAERRDIAEMLAFYRRAGVDVGEFKDLDPQALGRVLRVLVATLAAVAGYRPSAQPVPATVFYSAEGPGATHPAMGWDAYVEPERLRTVAVEGSHLGMMLPPHVAGLGQAITQALLGRGA